MAARYKAIADAFARVVVSTSYRDKWITDHDFVRIIACEYDLAIDDAIKFDVVMLNRALKNDTRYSLAEDQDGCEAGTVFRKHYTPNVAGSNQRRTVFCYCIGNQPRLHPCGKWSDNISSFSLRSLRKRCGILVEQAEMFRKAIASTTTPVKRKHVAAIELVSVTKALPTHDIAAATGELLNETTNLPLMKYYYGPTTVPVNTNAIKISGRLLLSLKYSLVFRLSTDLRRSITSRASGMERER
jgi:hypothetical protein